MPTVAKIDRVTKSPSDAAIGVAILSGFILIFWDKIITAIITAANIKLATDAVAILALVKTSAESGWNSPSLEKRNNIAPNEANAPTIMAWPYNISFFLY